jgi:hypothetical protein
MLRRRECLFMTAAAGVTALASPRLLAAGSAATLYSQSIVIDGLGFPGGRQNDEQGELLPLEVEDVRASGLTAVHVTVGAVGTMTRRWQPSRRSPATSRAGRTRSSATRRYSRTCVLLMTFTAPGTRVEPV